MGFNNLKDLKNSQLILELKNLVGEERKILNEILEYLHEVNTRKLYLQLAHSSLFEFCVKELGYSESSAYRRIEAMRLLKKLPFNDQITIKEKIEAGNLNLTHLTQAQGFFKAEEKQSKKSFSNSEKLEILIKIQGKSKRQTEKELIAISEVPPKREVTLKISEELMEKIEKLRALKSHSASNIEELLIQLVDDAFRKHPLNSARKTTGNIQRKATPPAEVGRQCRYIPASIKRQIWQRDQGKCTFKDSRGNQCQSNHFLQIDHIQEFSKMGSSTNPVNLRLLCGEHNRQRNQSS